MFFFKKKEKRKDDVRATKPGAISVMGSVSTKDTFAAEEMTETTIDDRKREMKREMKEKEVQDEVKKEGKPGVRATKPGAISVVGPGSTKDIFAAEEMTETKIDDRKREMKEKEKNNGTKKEKGKPGVHAMKPGAFPVIGAGPSKDVFAAEEMSETRISDRKRETKEKEREKNDGKKNQKGKSGVRATKPGVISVAGSGPTKDSFAAEEMTETTINDRKREIKEKVINDRIKDKKREAMIQETKPGAVSIVGSGPTKDKFAAEEMSETTIFDRKQERGKPGAVSVIGPDSTKEKNNVEAMPERKTTNLNTKQEKGGITFKIRKLFDTRTRKLGAVSMVDMEEMSKTKASNRKQKEYYERINGTQIEGNATDDSGRFIGGSWYNNNDWGSGTLQEGRMDGRVDNLHSIEYNEQQVFNRDEDIKRDAFKISDVKPTSTRRRKVTTWTTGVLIIIAFIAITLGIIFSSSAGNGGNSNRGNDDVELEKVADGNLCNYLVLKECRCDESDVTIPKDIELEFQSLKAGFLQDTILSADFDEGSNFCEPRKLALYWLAEDIIKNDRSRNERSLLTRFVLGAFFLSLSNNGLLSWKERKGWLTSVEECEWFGIKCDKDSNNVLRIALPRNELKGTIPAEISKFSKLNRIDLSSNSISETIPSEIGTMTKLTELMLNENYNLEGRIPSEIEMLSNLRTFGVSGNAFTGTIPAVIFKLTSIETLQLGQNQFEGAIPSEIGMLNKMTSMDLRDNFLSGTIPSEIGLLQNIRELFLSSNQIRGTIPTTFGLCTSLNNIDFQSTKIEGTIPSEIGKLTDLQAFMSTSTSLTGSMPQEICDLKKEEGGKLEHLKTFFKCSCCSDQRK